MSEDEVDERPVIGSTLQSFSIRAVHLGRGDVRLDATYYEGKWAELVVADSGLPVVRLGTVASVRLPGRFKRAWASDGVPFVGSREMYFWPLRAQDHISRTTPHLGQLFVRPGWILVNRSGTIGESLLVSRVFDGVAVTEHALRVVPTDIRPGYLYAFLRSRVGRALFTRAQFGAVVRHVEASNLEDIDVPMLPQSVIDEVDDLMGRSQRLIEQGARSIADAEKDIYARGVLPAVETLEVKHLEIPAGATLRPFMVRRVEFSDRLDASFHSPEVRSVQTAIMTSGLPVSTLGDPKIARITVPGRFKRIYVTRPYGVPLIQGTHVPMQRPVGLKYLSRTLHGKELGTHRLDHGQVLVTASGTIGRTGYVTRAWDGWVGSQHIARVAVTGDAVRPGYLYVFLSSPYGVAQVTGQSYGAVVNELSAEQLGTIHIPIPPDDIQNHIHEKVERGFALRDEANEIEDRAIALFEHEFEKASAQAARHTVLAAVAS